MDNQNISRLELLIKVFSFFQYNFNAIKHEKIVSFIKRSLKEEYDLEQIKNIESKFIINDLKIYEKDANNYQEIIESSIDKTWELKRIGSLESAILITGLINLLKNKKQKVNKKAMIISDLLDLSSNLIDDKKIKFINKALDEIYEKI